MAAVSLAMSVLQAQSAPTAELAIDSQIEHRQVADPPLDLQLGRDRPHVFWPGRRLCPDHPALIPKYALGIDHVCIFVILHGHHLNY
jgi:hypothetical protein